MLVYTSTKVEPAEGEASAPSAGPARYSADYLQETPSLAPPIVHVGFGADGQPSFILRSHGGRELKRITADRTNVANERPRGFFHSLAQLYWGKS
jgi:hypothetical protein